MENFAAAVEGRPHTIEEWLNMLSRSVSAGSRQIVDPRWYDYRVFEEEVGLAPAHAVLRRIDSSQPWSKDNVNWIANTLRRSPGGRPRLVRSEVTLALVREVLKAAEGTLSVDRIRRKAKATSEAIYEAIDDPKWKKVRKSYYSAKDLIG